MSGKWSMEWVKRNKGYWAVMASGRGYGIMRRGPRDWVLAEFQPWEEEADIMADRHTLRGLKELVEQREAS